LKKPKKTLRKQVKLKLNPNPKKSPYIFAKRKRRKLSMEKEIEEEIIHVCPKCGYKWKTIEIIIVEIEPELEEDWRYER